MDYNAYIREHLPSWIDELSVLLRQRSISCLDEGVTDCAHLLVGMMEKMGIKTTLFDTEYHPPFVYGEILEDPALPTILIYGHYDVQPPGDREAWLSDPFEPTIRDGRIYCRGAGDNKGQFFIHLKAAEMVRTLNGKLPVNLKFIFEGGEEIGSPKLGEFFASHRELLKANFAMNSDASMHESGRPTMLLGVKGCYAPIFEIRTANRDVHSMHGATVPSAAWRMVGLLSTLKGEDGRVLIDGFYDDVRDPYPEELEAVKAIPNAEAQIKADLGLDHFVQGRVTDNYNYNTVFEPTCNINSLRSGHLGAGNNNIVPATARVRLDMRLVPNQTPQKMHELFKAHLHKHGYDDVEFLSDGGVGMPCRVPLDNPYVLAIQDALRESFGEEPILYPGLGGTGPSHIFLENLGIYRILVPFASSDQNDHGVNENLKISDFENGIRASAAIMHKIGSMPAEV